MSDLGDRFALVLHIGLCPSPSFPFLGLSSGLHLEHFPLEAGAAINSIPVPAWSNAIPVWRRPQITLEPAVGWNFLHRRQQFIAQAWLITMSQRLSLQFTSRSQTGYFSAVHLPLLLSVTQV